VLSSKLLLASAIAVALVGSTLAISSFYASAQDNNEKTVNSPGFGFYKTTGDVLDPTGSNGFTGTAEIDPAKYLRNFNYGRVSQLENGTTLREFTIIADDRMTTEISPGISYNVWTFNGTVPGPTLRATEGDLVRIHFINNGTKPHSMHFHGIHKAEMDGVLENIGPGGQFVYEFYAEPVGLHLYHCHVMPLEEHISHGLYGVYIVDPKTPRPDADEMVMMMNGYDTDFDTENNFYTVNGLPFYYMHHPIQIQKDRLVRIYLVNILEFDQINNFHLHGNLFQLYRTGTSMEPNEYTDMVTMSQGERAVLEFSYKYPGQYMFHAHKTEFSEKGWVGMFNVRE
jgi:manganese oxidase